MSRSPLAARRSPLAARRSPLAARRSPLAAVLLTCGCTSYTFTRLPAEEASDLACKPEDISFVTQSAGTAEHLGRAVEVLSIGGGIGSENNERFVASGAPGDDSDETTGSVYLSRASIGDGTTPHATVPTLVEQVLSAVGSERHFGRALLAVDIQDCHPDGGLMKACGEELLVGAPDLHVRSTGGYVNWFRQTTDPNYVLERVGRIYPDSVLPVDAQFGFSFAAPGSPPDPSVPWEVAPDVPPWLAIGAPGMGEVLVYHGFDPAAADPLCLKVHDPACTTEVWHLAVGVGDGSFGYSLAAGDFDGDGHTDLAVGEPFPTSGSDLTGSTYIYWNTGSTPPFDGTRVALGAADYHSDAGFAAHEDWFGFSLAAGRFGPRADEAVPHDVLVVGAPLMGDADDRGAICAISIDAGRAVTYVDDYQCFGPNYGGISYFEEFGYAVAVGNFNSIDTFGSESSDVASWAEVAVGSPGWDADRGRVDVYTTGLDGIRELFLASENIQDHAGAAAGARFGDSLASGHVQNRHWEDLVVGSPHRSADDGSSTLTKAVALHTCDEINGAWTATEPVAGGLDREIRTWGNPHASAPKQQVTFPESFRIDIRDNYGSGAICTAEDGDGNVHHLEKVTLPADTRLTLPGAVWSCGVGSQTWYDVSADHVIAAIADSMGYEDQTVAGEVMDVEFLYHPSAYAKLYIDIAKLDFSRFSMDDTCRIAGMPLTLTNRQPICE